jgi:hypothetical protein
MDSMTTPSALVGILSQSPKKPLYHYTNQKGLLGIVERRAIWATHHQYLNDQSEFTHAQNLIDLELERRLIQSGDDPSKACLDQLRRSLQLQYRGCFMFVCSFSEAPDELSQWRAYSPQSPGFAIGFSPTILETLAHDRSWSLVRCVYDVGEQQRICTAIIDEMLEQIQKPTSRTESDATRRDLQGLHGAWFDYLNQYALLLKHKSFSNEQEWRLISRPMHFGYDKIQFREGRSSIIPYVEFPLANEKTEFCLDSLVVGPTPNYEQAERAILSLLASRKIARRDGTAVHIRTSATPFRNW